MASRKKSTNGTVEVPSSTVLHHVETNGNQNKIEKPNQKGKRLFSQGKISLEDELNTTELLKVLAEVKNGNFSVRMPFDKVGISGKICDTLNEIISLNEIL